MIEMLTPIWCSVLRRSSIEIENNFFEAGGDLQAADSLFAEIAAKLGRELPSSTIYRAPSLAALAVLLEQPSLPRFSPFVQLKPGVETTPILIAHGLAGTASFFGLARSIRTGHAVYGMQARGVDGMEEPFDRVEQMAESYLDALHELQPRGPYILIGYSFGGLVALEMAQRLSGNGERIAQLLMIDAYPHPRFLSMSQRLSLMARRTNRHISEMKRQSAPDAITYLFQGLKRRFRMSRVSGDRPELSRFSLERTTMQVKKKAYVAYGQYSPRFYRGKMRFLRAEVNSYFPNDPASVWGKLASELEVETVPGSHLDMVTTEFEGLAAAITRYTSEGS
ncbi:MAG: alpha/beta fold hydrolase [Candidatus Sulfotelmatobacter sp.]